MFLEGEDAYDGQRGATSRGGQCPPYYRVEHGGNRCWCEMLRVNRWSRVMKHYEVTN